MKTTAILVELWQPLRFLPAPVAKLFFQVLARWFRGVTKEHDEAWRRMWRRLRDHKQAKPVLQLYEVVDRDARFHALHMAIESRIFEAQDHFVTLSAFRWWLKTGIGFGRFHAFPQGLVFEPSSLGWEDCSDDEMHAFHDESMRFLRSEYALAILWPCVKPEDRPAMLEAAILQPQEENQP